MFKVLGGGCRRYKHSIYGNGKGDYYVRKAFTAEGAVSVGPYSHAVESGEMIYLSGQTPIESQTGRLIEGGIAAQTGQCFKNLFNVLKANYESEPLNGRTSMKTNISVKINRIIDFLETDIISVTFSSHGLKYLSLRGNRGTQRIDLKLVSEDNEPASLTHLLIEETLNFLETGNHNMPLDLSDFTPFQRNVFDAVRSIKLGSVCTYKELAEILGKSGAAQAVGSAVSKNPVSYFLPTHRVLPQKGIGICKSGAGFLREKLLALEGHDLTQLRGNYICSRKKCCQE